MDDKEKILKQYNNSSSSKIIISSLAVALGLRQGSIVLFSTILGFDNSDGFYGNHLYFENLFPMTRQHFMRLRKELLEKDLIFYKNNNLFIKWKTVIKLLTKKVEQNVTPMEQNVTPMEQNVTPMEQNVTPINKLINKLKDKRERVRERAPAHNASQDLNTKIKALFNDFNFSKNIENILTTFITNNKFMNLINIEIIFKQVADKLKEYKEPAIIALIESMLLEGRKVIYWDRLTATAIKSDEPEWLDQIIESYEQ